MFGYFPRWEKMTAKEIEKSGGGKDDGKITEDGMKNGKHYKDERGDRWLPLETRPTGDRDILLEKYRVLF